MAGYNGSGIQALFDRRLDKRAYYFSTNTTFYQENINKKVNATIFSLIEIIENLNDYVKALSTDGKELKDAISIFKI